MTEPTDAEIISVAVSEGVRVRTGSAAIKFARAVLAKWGQPQTVAGEPVAYVEVSQSDSEVSMTWGPEPAGFGLPSGRHTLFTTTQTTQAQAGAVNIDAAAKKLAECLNYQWDYMSYPSQEEMRKHAQAVIESAHNIKGGQYGAE